MRNANDSSSSCHHCGAPGTQAGSIIIGSWVVCGVCGRPRRRFQASARSRRSAWARRLLAPWMLVLLTASLAAQAGTPPRALVVTAENLMAGDERHQTIAATGGDATALLPGDVVLYRLRFTNVTDGEVRGVVFTNPVPHGMRYVGRSAGANRDDVITDFSIDGGRTYGARPMVVQMVDGKRVQQPAPPEQYSHVRWTVRGSISPGATVTAEFRAALPQATPEDSSSQDESTTRP